MDHADRYKLLHGPYRMPRCRVGSRLRCEVRAEVIVCGISDAPIPWPPPRGKRGRRFLIVCGGLAKAVRTESEIAVAYWWGVTPQTVWRWRKALGVPRTNEGSSRLWRDHFDERIGEVQPLAAAKATDPRRRAKLATARRGKPQPAHVRAAIARANRERVVSEQTRRKMSAAHRRRGTRPPKAGSPWTAEEDALIPELPAAEVALRTGRTLRAVYDRRRQFGLPDGRAGRKLLRRGGQSDS